MESILLKMRILFNKIRHPIGELGVKLNFNESILRLTYSNGLGEARLIDPMRLNPLFNFYKNFWKILTRKIIAKYLAINSNYYLICFFYSV
ncbi:MAG: hypothetical protein S4CHLAM6_10270 [Chlamydiae bacterium]|nr:hypothetical protein [Chlamydiota bacterium]